MHGVLGLELVDDHGVAGLVIGGELLGVGGHDAALLFRACNDLQHGLVDHIHADEGPFFSGGEQGGLVEQVFQVCAGEADGGLGDGPQVHVLCQGLVAGVDAKDLLPPLDVGQADVDLPVEPAGTQQGGVQDVRPVGGGQDDDALVGGEAVHLD